MKKIILNEYQVEFVTNNIETETLTHLSEHLGIPRQTLVRKIKELGLTKKTRLSLQDRQSIVASYASGMSLTQIGEQIGCSASHASTILKQYNIKARKQENLQRKLEYDEYIFDHVDTKEKAYFLGVLFADGYNAEYRNAVRLGISVKDVEMLHNFKNFLGYSGEIKFCQENICYIDITNKHLSVTLSNLGATQNKSATLSFPASLNEKLYGAFLLGYSDGDGWFSKWRSTPEWGFCSSEVFCKQVRDILQYIGIKTHIKKACGCYRLVAKGRKQVFSIFEFLYSESCKYYLKRKHSKAKEILGV